MDLNQLRQTLRTQRSQLNAAERIDYALKITSIVFQQDFFSNSQHIACYWPFECEIATQFIISKLWGLNKQCYLPVIEHSSKELQFYQYQQDSELAANKYGIAEPIPEPGNHILPQQLDLVLLPIVAFDIQGHRLGTGGGYYDRTFKFLNIASRPLKPRLIGLGYEFQKVDALPAQAWDVTLDAIITEQHIYKVTP